MTIINVLGQIERYELVELNNKKVYFPKENKAYIEELLGSKDPDKLLYIADFYTEFHEDELAYYYFNSYTGYNSEFKARIANKLGVELATKELQTESYVEEEKYKEYNRFDEFTFDEIEVFEIDKMFKNLLNVAGINSTRIADPDAVGGGHNEAEEAISYVPYRNTMLLTIAAAIAEQRFPNSNVRFLIGANLSEGMIYLDNFQIPLKSNY